MRNFPIIDALTKDNEALAENNDECSLRWSGQNYLLESAPHGKDSRVALRCLVILEDHAKRLTIRSTHDVSGYPMAITHEKYFAPSIRKTFNFCLKVCHIRSVLSFEKLTPILTADLVEI